MTKSESELTSFLKILAIGFFIIIAIGFSFLLYDNISGEEVIVTEIRREYVYDEFLTRNRINDTITDENYFFILGYYTELTRNRNVTEAILENALELEIPVNIAFALAFIESRFVFFSSQSFYIF